MSDEAPVPLAEQIEWLREQARMMEGAMGKLAKRDETMLRAVLATLQQHERLTADPATRHLTETVSGKAARNCATGSHIKLAGTQSSDTEPSLDDLFVRVG